MKQLVSPPVTVTVEGPAITTSLTGSNKAVGSVSAIVAVIITALKPFLSVAVIWPRVVMAENVPSCVKFRITRIWPPGTCISNVVLACTTWLMKFPAQTRETTLQRRMAANSPDEIFIQMGPGKRYQSELKSPRQD